MDMPEEIWRHILSYNLLPYTACVCSDLYYIEESLAHTRCEYMDKMYIGWKSGNTSLLLAMGEIGDRDSILYLIRYGSYYSYNIIAYGAASRGHISILNMMLKMGANDYDWIARSAASGGYKDIVEMMLKMGASDYDIIACGAAWNGDKDIVEMMLKMGVSDYNWIARYAYNNGYHSLSSWIRQYES